MRGAGCRSIRWIFGQTQNFLDKLANVGAVGHAGISESFRLQPAFDCHGENPVAVLKVWETLLQVFDPLQSLFLFVPPATGPSRIDQKSGVLISHSDRANKS